MGGFVSTLKTWGDRASFEADKFMRANRVRSEIQKLKKEIEAAYAEVGHRVVEMHQTGRLPETATIDAAVARIHQLERALQLKEAEAMNVQTEHWVEPSPAVQVIEGGGPPPPPNTYSGPPQAYVLPSGSYDQQQAYQQPPQTYQQPTQSYEQPPQSYQPAPTPPPPPPMPTPMPTANAPMPEPPTQALPTRHCATCGAELRPAARFCPTCGTPAPLG